MSLEMLDLEVKRLGIKSQQLKQRYQKKTRGQFAWAANEQKRDKSPYSSFGESQSKTIGPKHKS